MAERGVHVVVSGRVQGVGYRAWLEDEARKRGLAGWVRNRRDGTVEAVFAGSAGDVAEVVAACRRGPLGSEPKDVAVSDYEGPALSRFTILPTA